jgi:spore maturation protein CgeB
MQEVENMKFQNKQILIYKWKAYNYLDVCQAFLAMGFEVDIVEQHLPSYDEDEAFSARLSELLRQKSYDFVFTINYFGVISDTCEQAGVPYVSWSCDSPLISMYHESVYNACNYIFLFDKSSYLFFKALGAANIWHLPLAVDTGRISHILEHADDLKLYQNEISLVGSLYERNTYDRIIPTLPQYLKGYFDCAIEAQMNISGGNLIEQLLTDEILQELEQYYHLEKTERSFSDLRLIFATTVLGLKVAKEQRRSCLLELAKKHQVSIYTNSNTQDLLRVDYRGSVDYWTQMPKVFYGSRINLNLTIPNIKTGIPLRVWDVLGAGGFLMTNYQPELELYFDLDKDLAVFENKRELERKAAYYLEHEKERLEIARNGHEKVKQFHSYEKRMAQMMEILEQEEFPGRGA